MTEAEAKLKLGLLLAAILVLIAAVTTVSRDDSYTSYKEACEKMWVQHNGELVAITENHYVCMITLNGELVPTDNVVFSIK